MSTKAKKTTKVKYVPVKGGVKRVELKDANLPKCAQCKKVEVKTKRHKFCSECAKARLVETFNRAYAKRAKKQPGQVKRRVIGSGGVLSAWAKLNPKAAKALAKEQNHTKALELLKAA
jgi:hypothetical protein